MTLLAIFNIVGTILLLCALLFMLTDKRKTLSDYTKLILGLLIAVLLFTSVSNILVHLGITQALDYFKDYVEMFIPLFWALLILSIQNSIAQGELVKSLRFQELALEGANQGLWSWNIVTDECTFDRRWLNILEYDRNDIEPHIETWTKLMHPDDKPHVDEQMQLHLRGETDHFEVEQRLRTKSGRWKWVLDQGRVIERNDKGEPLYMAGTLQDITQSKLLTDKLTSSQELYKTVFENTGNATIIIEGDTTISKANQQAKQLLGYDSEQIEGVRKWSDFVAEEDLEMMLDYHRRRRAGDHSVPTQYECHFLRPNGKKLDILATIAMIPNTDKSVASLLDITERRKSEQSRIDMEREVRYAQRLESLGVMAGGIAHDFNNLLMVIMGNADLIKEAATPQSEIRHNSEQIVKASRKAADICKQMLAYSGDQNLVVENIDLNMEINKISKMLKMSVASNAVLQYRLSENIPLISADIMQLRQMILNLVINASEAVERDSGYITLATGSVDCSSQDLKSIYVDDKLPPGDYAYIKVYDTGVGMNEDTQRHLFDPFFTTKFPGRGLGMSTVLGIVRSHKGVVKVESELEKGSTVTVLLPVAEQGVQAGADATDENTGQVEISDFKLSGKLLLVDDDAGVAAVAASMLKKFGLEVLTAGNGIDGLEKFGQHKDIDCVMMDLSMPRMGGEAATREIRQLNPDVPIFISSGYDETKIKKIFKDLNIQGIIGKPYERQMLYDKLRPILGGQG